MVSFEKITASIKDLIPDAHVTIEDMSGGGDHFNVHVVSSEFEGLSKIQQHQLVYKSLKEELASEAIHALALKTSTP